MAPPKSLSAAAIVTSVMVAVLCWPLAWLWFGSGAAISCCAEATVAL